MVWSSKSASNAILEERGYTTRDIDWASPEQEQAFNYGPAPLCLSGGYGAAKTFVICLKVLWLMYAFPNSRWVIARRQWVDLQKTTMATFFKVCPREAYNFGGRRSDAEKVLTINNGSTLYWLHLDDPEAANVIQGIEINGFFIDQAEEVEEEIFDKLLTRLGRWDQVVVPDDVLALEPEGWPWVNGETGQPMVPPYAFLTCNPDLETHWIYRKFHPDSDDHHSVQIGEEGDVPSYRDQGYLMITMDSRNNKFLSRHNLREMMRKDPAFVRKYVKGQWGQVEGLIHKITPLSEIEATRELVAHLVRSCTLYRVLDHGDAAPTCCTWWAVDQAGNLFCYREYYKPNALISTHRQNITDMSIGERYVDNLADPSIFAPTMQKYGGRWSVSSEYADCVNLPRTNALFWAPGDNNELATRDRINEYLLVDPERVHPITKTKGSPQIFFLKATSEYPQGCKFILKETKAQRREKIGTERGKPIFSDDREKSVSDHSYDTLRYVVASRPRKASAAAQVENPNTFFAVMKRVHAYYQRGGHVQSAAIVAEATKRRFA